MPWRRAGALALGATLVLCASLDAESLARPNVVFVLLDTTRADHFGSWGYRDDTTPVLDALAARGVRFRRHYANSHATRPSMPQLMSGRYYRDNILAPFQPNAHPREMTFARPDPTAVLLPRLFHDAGYATQGVSAHTWVSPDSELGRTFDRFELLPFTTKEAHGDAAPLVDRALAMWQARDHGRPLLLYVHFMDMHIPRRLPEGETLRPLPGYDWHERFRPDGEPAFDRDRREWSRYDASDFTADDRAHYTAVYDTRLRYADTQLGRLFAALERDDPGLRNTVIVVTADHGEELGENERIEHPPSLSDAVQHIPWIVAGGGLARGQRCEGFTQHVDVVPSLAVLLALPMPAGTHVDGVSWFEGGGLQAGCGRHAAYYAWEEYRGIRRGRYAMVEYPARSIEAHCGGVRRLFRIDGQRQRPVAGPAADRRIAWLARDTEKELGARERAYLASRYGAPHDAFFLRTDLWGLEPATSLRCVTVNEDTPRSTLVAPGWFTTGRGVALTDGAPTPTGFTVAVPPGSYEVEAGLRPVSPAPWLFGVGRWRRRSFRKDVPSEFRKLGTIDASAGQIRLPLPPDILAGSHVLGLRLTPPGVIKDAAPAMDPAQHERLKALGYVQ
jgi:arylsulfatase A-like enzyme